MEMSYLTSLILLQTVNQDHGIESSKLTAEFEIIAAGRALPATQERPLATRRPHKSDKSRTTPLTAVPSRAIIPFAPAVMVGRVHYGIKCAHTRLS